jgi:hypothetical protein
MIPSQEDVVRDELADDGAELDLGVVRWRGGLEEGARPAGGTLRLAAAAADAEGRQAGGQNLGVNIKHYY